MIGKRRRLERVDNKGPSSSSKFVRVSTTFGNSRKGSGLLKKANLIVRGLVHQRELLF